MPDYVLLMKADRNGSVGLLGAGSESQKRYEAAVRALGGTVHSYLAVTGSYDLVVYASFDDEVASLLTSHVWNAAGMYTEVLRAFSSEELDRASEMRSRLTDLLPTPPPVAEDAEASSPPAATPREQGR